MASINFLYRSKRETANLTLRLLYRFNSIDFVFATNTKIQVTKEYWNKTHNLKRIKDIDLLNKQTEITNELNKIQNHVLTAFNETDTNLITKDWLTQTIEKYYNPIIKTEITTELNKYFDYYLQLKQNSITKNSHKRYISTKNLLTKYEKKNKTLLQIKDVNLSFKDSFERYCITESYAPNTITKAIKMIKTICLHAKDNRIETNYQLDSIKTKYHKTETIYFTFAELQTIEQTKYNDSLENVKDWLIISCYTGQRVSDFMNFTADKIRVENGKNLLEFTQKKTNKIMTIPIHPKVLEILNKRNGKFPKPISDQKYNDYIKEVCKIAGLTDLVQGSKKLETAPNSKKFRKDTGLYPKFDLVTSHIGRRSFATNFYGQIPTSYLIYVTGHSTEAMFLNYIGKSNKDLAMEITNYF
jgi:integrase